MGHYIETGQITHRKAQHLIDKYGATVVHDYTHPNTPMGQHLVCVVENGFFDAAAIIYNDREMLDFSASPTDHRARTWLHLSQETCAKLCPTYDDMLDELARG